MNNPTIEDRYKTALCIEGKDYEIEILNTACEEYDDRLLDMWISFGNGFMFIFSINDKQTLEQTKIYRDRIIRGKGDENYPIILVGNKQDLENERKVSSNEAKTLADSWGIPYIETSSKTNFNCKEAFEILAKNIIKYKSESKK